jgi:RimJ/RimL family protein N-acetyltransferase
MEPSLWDFVPYRITNKDEMLRYIQTALREQDSGVSIPFAMLDRASGTAAGSTRYMNMDAANRRVEIGSTWLGEPWRRTVLNTEAKYLMLRYAFETLGCIRVELKTDALNHHSRAAIVRLGSREGHFAAHMILWRGRLRDTVYYSVIDSEWPTVKAGLEAKLSARA